MRVGLSGYSYKPWQGEDRFYPVGLKQAEFFSFYASRYDIVEMDGTWYRMPATSQVEAWGTAAPEGFCFCFKAHRQVTHMARLKPEALEPLQFMMKRLEPMKDRLGPVLLQLPPNLKRDDERLKHFLGRLPETTYHRQWAVEFRNETWHDENVEAILREHNVAWVASDTDEADAQRRNTANFSYARLRKLEYDHEALDEWRSYFEATGKESYVFCKHEDEGSPWIWADYLLRK